MKKSLKWTAIVLAVLFLLVLAAGIYRFNFTDDDIYLQLPDGSVITWEEYERLEQAGQYD